TIMGEVRRYFRDAGWAMRVPRRMKELNLQISGATDRLAQRLGRSPSPREIATELGIPVADVSEGLLARGAYQTDSLDAAVRSDGDGLALGDLIGEEDPELEKVEGLAAIRPMLAELSERDRAILMMRFYGSMTQTQIAERVGISQMHVSRILSKTLKHLRARADTDRSAWQVRIRVPPAHARVEMRTGVPGRRRGDRRRRSGPGPGRRGSDRRLRRPRGVSAQR